jgi:cytochrome c oxidase subunit II
MPRFVFLLCFSVWLSLLAPNAEAVSAEGHSLPTATTVAHAPVPAAGMAITSKDPIADDVAKFNPNIFALNADGTPVNHNKSPFVEPASDIARKVVSITWFSALIFLPFLVLPLLLLLYVIFKFRDHGDDRKPATFTGNHKLEIIWTLIPCLALVVVSYPTWFILIEMESPPADKKDQMTVIVTGKQFAWDYSYKGYYKNPNAEIKQNIAIGQNMGIQDPLVLPKGRTVQLHMTSDDVNHAWWIPAFGVKKDCIRGRYTYVWFTPDTLGTYKGQCAELCGAGHGIMLISACIVTPSDFDRYINFQQAKDDTLKVWSAIQPPVGAQVDEKALREAVAGYLGKGKSAERQYALRFWIASNYSTLQRVPPPKGTTMAQVIGAQNAAEIPAVIKSRRDKVDALLSELVAHVTSIPDLVATASGDLP